MFSTFAKDIIPFNLNNSPLYPNIISPYVEGVGQPEVISCKL